MILYAENLKETTKKILEFLNKFSKIAGYKNPLSFHTQTASNSKKEIKGTITFTVAP